jgi:hypothetical protein
MTLSTEPTAVQMRSRPPPDGSDTTRWPQRARTDLGPQVRTQTAAGLGAWDVSWWLVAVDADVP